MTAQIILQVLLFGIALSADAFSVAVTEGLVFSDINKKKGLFIAFIFGLFQGLFPLVGYWLVEGISVIVGETAGAKAGHIMSTVVSWVAFGLLVFIGGKMILESIREMKKEEEQKEVKVFTIKEVLIMGVATAIDALATGVAFHNVNASGEAMSTNVTIWLHVSIIMMCTFVISLMGVYFGKFFRRLFKGKIEITGIIGGVILLALAVWIIASHYVL